MIIRLVGAITKWWNESQVAATWRGLEASAEKLWWHSTLRRRLVCDPPQAQSSYVSRASGASADWLQEQVSNVSAIVGQSRNHSLAATLMTDLLVTVTRHPARTVFSAVAALLLGRLAMMLRVSATPSSLLPVGIGVLVSSAMALRPPHPEGLRAVLDGSFLVQVVRELFEVPGARGPHDGETT